MVTHNPSLSCTEEGDPVPQTQGLLGTGILRRLRPTFDLHLGHIGPLAHASRAQHPHLQTLEGIQVKVLRLSDG